MGLLARLFSPALHAGTPGPTDDYWYQLRGMMTPAGVRIDADGAKMISAWYRGRDILATVLAMLPLPLMRRLPNDGGAEVARNHPLFDVLHDKPNGWQDSFQWRRQQMYYLIDSGNAYNRIVPGPRGIVDQLWPIDARYVTPRQVSSGALVYDIRDPKSSITRTSMQSDIFHLRGASDDGIVGKGILKYARTSLGTASATESYAAQVFGHGTLNSGVIENPGVLNDEASKRMAKSFVTNAGDWHLPKVLEQGSKWVESKMTPEDAQMLLSRKYTVDDIARWLGVPRQMLENSDPSFGNAEQFDRNFVAYSLGPWLSLFEFAINDQLVVANKTYFAQFTREALVRGDLAVRWQAHVAAVNAGIKSVDEVRAVENLNARGGKADELREPQNIVGKPAVGGADDGLEDGPKPGPRPPSPSPTPAKRKPAMSDQNSAQAEAIVTASAARLLRKEVAEVQKLAVRHAGDEDEFVSAVTMFYDKHVALVTLTLQMSVDQASEYCANQARQVVNGLPDDKGQWPAVPWVAALELWGTPTYAAGVAAMALSEPETA